MRNTLDHFKNLLRTGQSAAAHDIKRAVSRMQRDDRCIRRLIDRCGWYEQEIKRLKAPKKGWEQYAKRNGHPVTSEPTVGCSSGDCAEYTTMKKNNGWISAKKMLPRLTSAERKPSSFGRQVLIYPPIQEPGCADQHTAFYGCRLTDEPAFHLHGRVIDVEWWQPLPEPPRENNGRGAGQCKSGNW